MKMMTFFISIGNQMYRLTKIKLMFIFITLKVIGDKLKLEETKSFRFENNKLIQCIKACDLNVEIISCKRFNITSGEVIMFNNNLN